MMRSYHQKRHKVMLNMRSHVFRPEVIKRFPCSTQLSTKFQLLIKLNNPKMKKFIALSLSDVVFNMLINVKMPFMSRINRTQLS